jgi:ketosteroid isomerase-like protein
MAGNNAELIRQGYEAYAERGLDAIMDLLDPEVEFVEPQFIPGAESFRGHDGARQWFAKIADVWGELRFEPEEMAEAGDRVAVAFRIVARGKGSGLELEEHWAHVWTMRDGKAVRVEGFASRDDAWRAIGAA